MEEYNDLPIYELFKKVFEVNSDTAIEILIDHFQKESQSFEWSHFTGSLREDKNFNIKIIEKLDVNGGFFHFFFQIPPSLKDDKDVAIKCLEKSGMTFKYFSDRLKSDKDLALLLVKKMPSEHREIKGEIGEDVRYMPIQEMTSYIEAKILKEKLEEAINEERIEVKRPKI